VVESKEGGREGGSEGRTFEGASEGADGDVLQDAALHLLVWIEMSVLILLPSLSPSLPPSLPPSSPCLSHSGLNPAELRLPPRQRQPPGCWGVCWPLLRWWWWLGRRGGREGGRVGWCGFFFSRGPMYGCAFPSGHLVLVFLLFFHPPTPLL